MSADPAALVARLRPHWQVVEVRPLSGGFSNVSHWVGTARHGDFVLRQPRAGNPFAIDREAESHIARWAASKGLAPRVEYFDPRTGVQLCAAVAGTAVGDLPRADWPAPEAIGSLLCSLHHAAEFPRVGGTLTATLGEWRRRCRRLGRSLLPARPEPTVGDMRLCHQDVNPWNMLLAPDGTLTLIDWELAGPLDPRFDLANAILLFEYDATECKRFLAAACQGQVTLDELEPWLDRVREREYLWAELAMAAGIDDPDVRAQRDLRAAELQGVSSGSAINPASATRPGRTAPKPAGPGRGR